MNRSSHLRRYFSKQLFNTVSSWLYDGTLWKIPVKKFNFSNFAGIESTTSVRTEHSHAYFNWLCTDLEQLLWRRSPSGCSKMNKNRRLVLYNDQGKRFKERCKIHPVKKQILALMNKSK